MNRFDHWQIGYIFPKGGYRELRAAGLEVLREAVAELAPAIADRVQELRDWGQVSLLSVESNRLPRWWRPGLLLIGDAAHTMSPLGGVGINYAIHDAVVAANVLAGPLREGALREADLAKVQRRRELPVRIIQALQSLIQRRVIGDTLRSRQPFTPPLLLRLVLRLPGLRGLPARLIAFGPWRVRLKAQSITAPIRPDPFQQPV